MKHGRDSDKWPCDTCYNSATVSEDQWHYYTSDWDHTEDAYAPTPEELEGMLRDWLNDQDETTGTWALQVWDGDVLLHSAVVML